MKPASNALPLFPYLLCICAPFVILRVLFGSRTLCLVAGAFYFLSINEITSFSAPFYTVSLNFSETSGRCQVSFAMFGAVTMLDFGGESGVHGALVGGLVVRECCAAPGGFLGRAVVVLINGVQRVCQTLW